MDLTASPIASLFLLGILLLIAGHTLSLLRRGRWLALDPLNAFWGGVVVVYVLQPLQFSEVFVKWHTPGVLEWTLFWSLLAFLMVVAGYEVGWGRTWGRKFPLMPARLSTGRMAAVGVSLLVLGVLGYVYLIGTAQSVWEWLSVPRGGTNWKVVNSYIATLTSFLPVGTAFLFFMVQSRPVGWWARALMWGLAWLLVVWYFYLGSRSQVIALILMMLAAYYLPRRRNPPVWLMGLTFLALMIAVGFIGSYRENFTNLSFNLEQIDLEEAGRRVLPKFLGGDTKLQKSEVAGGNDFNCVMTVVELVPEEVDFNYGYCLMEFLTRPIPRSFWEDKRYPHYEAFTPLYLRGALSGWEIRSTSQSPVLAGPVFTFVGHWYAVGGPLVLLVAGFLTGSFLRMIRTLYDRCPGSQGDQFLYFTLMPIGFGEAAGTPLFWIFNLPYWTVAIGLLYLCGQPQGPTGGKPARTRSPHRGALAWHG